jgi:hypothetical protein
MLFVPLRYRFCLFCPDSIRLNLSCHISRTTFSRTDSSGWTATVRQRMPVSFGAGLEKRVFTVSLARPIGAKTCRYLDCQETINFKQNRPLHEPKASRRWSNGLGFLTPIVTCQTFGGILSNFLFEEQLLCHAIGMPKKIARTGSPHTLPGCTLWCSVPNYSVCHLFPSSPSAASFKCNPLSWLAHTKCNPEFRPIPSASSLLQLSGAK